MSAWQYSTYMTTVLAHSVQVGIVSHHISLNQKKVNLGPEQLGTGRRRAADCRQMPKKSLEWINTLFYRQGGVSIRGAVYQLAR